MTTSKNPKPTRLGSCLRELSYAHGALTKALKHAEKMRSSEAIRRIWSAIGDVKTARADVSNSSEQDAAFRHHLRLMAQAKKKGDRT